MGEFQIPPDDTSAIPTQVKYRRRTMLRSLFQLVPALAALAASVAAQWPDSAIVTSTAAAFAGMVAFMTHPAVNAAIETHAPWLAAAPGQR